MDQLCGTRALAGFLRKPLNSPKLRGGATLERAVERVVELRQYCGRRFDRESAAPRPEVDDDVRALEPSRCPPRKLDLHGPIKAHEMVGVDGDVGEALCDDGDRVAVFLLRFSWVPSERRGEQIYLQRNLTSIYFWFLLRYLDSKSITRSISSISIDGRIEFNLGHETGSLTSPTATGFPYLSL
jgi:hypothetical protein